MKKTITLILFTIVVFPFFSCERPSSPDFELQQDMEIPLIKEVTYVFLGEGSGAIVDTTSEDFKNLFYETGSGLAVLSSEINVQLGNFDAISPDITVETASVNAEIGPISIDDFSSFFETEIGVLTHREEQFDDESANIGVFDVTFEAMGTTLYGEISQQPGAPSSGTPLPESSEPITVYMALQSGAFESALIESGQIRLDFENDLGFDLASMEVSLMSSFLSASNAGEAIGTPLLFEGIGQGEEATGHVLFSEEDLLQEPLALRLVVEWEAQSLTNASGELNALAFDDPLRARSAVADIPTQELDPETELLEMENPGFEYAVVADDREEGPFELRIEVTNRTSLDVTDRAGGQAPAIRVINSDGDVLGDQEVHYLQTPGGAPRLGAGESGVVTIELYGHTLTRVLEYELDMGTPGGDGKNISESDGFDVMVSTGSLKFTRALADIDPQENIDLQDEKAVDGDFVEAEVDTGHLTLTFTNQSAIDLIIDELELTNATEFVAKNTGQFFAAGSAIGTLHDVMVPAGQSITEVLPIDGAGISNRIAYSGTASSPGTTTSVEIASDDLLATDMDGSVHLQSAEAAIKPQEFTSTGYVTISEEDVILAREDHYIDLASGMMVIGSIENHIDLDMDTLIVSFPGMLIDRNLDGHYDPADSLWVVFSGEESILRSRDGHIGQPTRYQSLENVRLYAPGNQITYHTRGVTRDTRTSQGEDTLRSVRADEQFHALVDIDHLEIKTTYGLIQPRTELLNDDPDEDGIIDLFNDQEVEISEFNDLEVLSEKISGLQFIQPVFDLLYDTNLGAESVVIAAIVGINSDGEERYLNPVPGSEYEVRNGEDHSGLYARGSPIPSENLLRFEIEPSPAVGERARNRVVRFDIENSNVADFLSNLPTEIRFVGNVITSPDGTEGFISKPVDFASSMAIDIPINLETEKGSPASVEDTFSADLSGLPSPEDDVRITEMALFVTYENALPFETGFELLFLDEHDQVIMTGRGDPLERISFTVGGAAIDQETRFVAHPSSDMNEIHLTGEQLDYLYRTRNIMLRGELNSSRDEESGEVKLRGRDYLKMKINSSFSTSVRVN